MQFCYYCVCTTANTFFRSAAIQVANKAVIITIIFLLLVLKVSFLSDISLRILEKNYKLEISYF